MKALPIKKSTPSPSTPNIKNKDFLWLENNKNILNTSREKNPQTTPLPQHTYILEVSHLSGATTTWETAIHYKGQALSQVSLSVAAGHAPNRVVFLCAPLPPARPLSSSGGHFTFATLKLHFNLATFPLIISSSFLFLHFGEYWLSDLLNGFSNLPFPSLFVFWL